MVSPDKLLDANLNYATDLSFDHTIPNILSRTYHIIPYILFRDTNMHNRHIVGDSDLCLGKGMWNSPFTQHGILLGPHEINTTGTLLHQLSKFSSPRHRDRTLNGRVRNPHGAENSQPNRLTFFTYARRIPFNT